MKYTRGRDTSTLDMIQVGKGRSFFSLHDVGRHVHANADPTATGVVAFMEMDEDMLVPVCPPNPSDTVFDKEG